jgi:hypothetical protein
VDTVDRLAAYLAGDLDADERDALEGELTRDPVLRAQLEALRRADTVLAQLRSPEPSADFETRLHAALEPVVAEVLQTHGSTTAAERIQQSGLGDELAARRVRRTQRTWFPKLVGVAAAATLVVGGGIVVSGIVGGGDDAGEASVAMDAMDDMDGMESSEQDDALTLESSPATATGPTVVVSDRELAADDVDALLVSVELQDVTDRQLGGPDGAELAMAWRGALGPPPAMGDDSEAGDSDVAAGAPSADRQVLGGELGPEDEQAITRCLDELLTGEGEAIPVYVEVASFDGEPALVFGLVTLDPATGAYTRPEAWVLARADCQVLRFSQG